MSRILVLEHNRKVGRDISARLRARRHEVTVARDAPFALQLARMTKPDLVLLDIGAPAEGAGMAGRIQDLAGRHGVRFIFFDSAEGRLGQGTEGTGRRGYDPEQLLLTVERVLAA